MTASGDQMLSLPVGSSAVDYFSLIGNPFDQVVPWRYCAVTDGNWIMTLPDAVAAGYIHKVRYWNNSNWYDVTDLSTGNMAARKGYEIYPKYNNLAVIVPAQ